MFIIVWLVVYVVELEEPPHITKHLFYIIRHKFLSYWHKGAFTLGVKDPSVESPNAMPII
jgi:hypothetical protein